MCQTKPKLGWPIITLLVATFGTVASAVHIETQSGTRTLMTSHLQRTSAMPCVDSHGCEQQTAVWQHVESAVSQAESGLLMVWRSVVSSAKRRDWLPQRFHIWAEEQPALIQTELFPKQHVKEHSEEHVQKPGAHSEEHVQKPGAPAPETSSGGRTIVCCLCAFLVVAIYSLAYAQLVWEYYNPHTGTKMARSKESSPRRFGDMEKSESLAISTDTVIISTDELFDVCGVSAMCILNPEQRNGVTNLKNQWAVLIIALQSVLLQGGLFFYMWLQLVPRKSSTGEEHPLPIAIVFIALYLHFLNCVQELPYSIQLFRHLGDFHSRPFHLYLMGGVLITDAFVVPTLAFVLGSMYICTSRTVGDVILNAVAVAFIIEIDNWVLAIDNRTNILAGRIDERPVHIPNSASTMRKISWGVVFCPVLPMMAASAMIWFSYYVLSL